MAYYKQAKVVGNKLKESGSQSPEDVAELDRAIAEADEYLKAPYGKTPN